MRRLAAVALVLVLPAVVSACGASTSWILSPEGCSTKATVDATLIVDPSDDRWIWGVDRTTGADMSLRLPGGYGVSTGTDDGGPPALVMPSGMAFGHTGDHVVTGCRDIVQNALMIDENDVEQEGLATP